MFSWVEIAVSVAVGIGIGLLYFGGLWWTVVRIQSANNPLALYMISLVLRSAIAVMFLVLVLQAGIFHMLAAFVGFLGVRIVLVSRWGMAHQPQVKRPSEFRGS